MHTVDNFHIKRKRMSQTLQRQPSTNTV